MPADPLSLTAGLLSSRGIFGTQELEAALAAASIVVLPYTQASQSGVGSLAVARGVPVVVSDVGALPDLALTADHVVPAGSPAALADALVRHVDDGPDVRASVLATIAAPRSWRAVGRQTAELYTSLVTDLR